MKGLNTQGEGDNEQQVQHIDNQSGGEEYTTTLILSQQLADRMHWTAIDKPSCGGLLAVRTKEQL